MAAIELYRNSKIGKDLMETLDEMVNRELISPDLAIHVFVQFVESLTEALETKVRTKVSITILRQCLDRTFILQDAKLRHDGNAENVGRLRIVACDSELELITNMLVLDI